MCTDKLKPFIQDPNRKEPDDAPQVAYTQQDIYSSAYNATNSDSLFIIEANQEY